MQTPQISSQVELMASIDEALKEPPPEDIMSARLLDDILFYIMPIISFVIFIVIVLYGVIPNATAMSDKINAVNQLKQQDLDIKERIVKLEALKNSLAGVQDVINKLDSIVPEGKTEVVKFSQRVRAATDLNMERFVNIPKEKPIVMNDISTGEAELATDSGTVQGLKINQVPTEFTFTGGFERFRQFFTNLYGGSDFFVVEEMSLSYDPINQIWNGNISLVKYQFSKDANFIPGEVYGTISEDAQPNAEVVEFIQTKFVEGSL